jgi:hypothetical protein
MNRNLRDRTGSSSKPLKANMAVVAGSGTTAGTGTRWPNGLDDHGEGGFASCAFALPKVGGRSDSNDSVALLLFGETEAKDQNSPLAPLF